MRWTVSSRCQELEDSEAFYFEVAATQPTYQRTGLYKLLQSLAELEAYDAGFKIAYGHSIREGSEIHLKTGAKIIRELPKYWHYDNGTLLDGFLMKIELTKSRLCRDVKIVVPEDFVGKYLSAFCLH